MNDPLSIAGLIVRGFNELDSFSMELRFFDGDKKCVDTLMIKRRDIIELVSKGKTIDLRCFS